MERHLRSVPTNTQPDLPPSGQAIVTNVNAFVRTKDNLDLSSFHENGFDVVRDATGVSAASAAVGNVALHPAVAPKIDYMRKMAETRADRELHGGELVGYKLFMAGVHTLGSYYLAKQAVNKRLGRTPQANTQSNVQETRLRVV